MTRIDKTESDAIKKACAGQGLSCILYTIEDNPLMMLAVVTDPIHDDADISSKDAYYLGRELGMRKLQYLIEKKD